MARYTSRENAMINIYMHLITGKSMKEVFSDAEFSGNISDFLSLELVDDEMREVCLEAESRHPIYASALEQYLNKWRFDRLGYVEQAIFLLACAELEFGDQHKTVIVSEAVRLAKTYGDDDSYKLINGVLDAL